MRRLLGCIGSKFQYFKATYCLHLQSSHFYTEEWGSRFLWIQHSVISHKALYYNMKNSNIIKLNCILFLPVKTGYKFPHMQTCDGTYVFIYGQSINQTISLQPSTSPEPSTSVSAQTQLLLPMPFGKQRCPSPHAPLWNWQAFDTEKENKPNLFTFNTCCKMRLFKK